MKLFHLSDLHLGKRLNEYSLLEDQRYILMNECLRLIDEKKPEIIILAGDIFDKSIASVEAIELLEEFLERLVERKKKIIIIPGNHDSAQRLSFCSAFMKKDGIYNARPYEGKIEKISFEDEYGEVNFYLLPFVKPANVRAYFEDESIDSYNEAIRLIIEKEDIDTEKRNVLVTHQFITGSIRTMSEEISVGGTDNIDAANFKDFDYVALGHIHKAQNISNEAEGIIRYCGTLLKYSFSEADDCKTLSLVNLGKKGEISIEELPIKPLRDLRIIKAQFEDILKAEVYNEDDYVEIILTDELEVPKALPILRKIYPNIMKISYDNTRTRNALAEEGIKNTENLSPSEIFKKFYKEQNAMDINEEQEKILNEIIEDIWG